MISKKIERKIKEKETISNPNPFIIIRFNDRGEIKDVSETFFSHDVRKTFEKVVEEHFNCMSDIDDDGEDYKTIAYELKPIKQIIVHKKLTIVDM